MVTYFGKKKEKYKMGFEVMDQVGTTQNLGILEVLNPIGH